MKSKISFQNTERIHLKLNGSFDIDVCLSDDFIGVEYDSECDKTCKIKNENDLFYFDADEENVEWNSEIKESVSKLNFKGGILNFLESTRPIIETILTKKKSQKVNLKLFLTKKLGQLIVDADNVNIDFGKIQLQKLSIKADNCNIRCSDTISVANIDVSADNLKAVIPFGGKAPFWTILSDNASVVIKREKMFNGQIRVIGDNMDVSGKITGDEKIGLLTIKADNADVNIKD